MASSGGVRLNITQQGFKEAKKQLESLGRKIDPVLRGALDSTATDARKRRYTPIIAPMFKNRSFVNKRIIIKRVNLKKGRIDARLIPSSSGIEVTDYRRWGYQAINATRARIMVGSFKGHKIAAGFVNPSGAGRKPLSTKSERARNLKKPPKFDSRKSYKYNTGLTEALGPSVAFFFKRLTNQSTVAYINKHLQAEFSRRLRKELLKGAAR